jgi:hypothetical protein
MRTVAFCEINSWCRRLLARHWPSVPVFEDVTTIGVEPMSSAADSPARTSALPAEAPALPAAVPLSGGGYAEPFAWYDRNTQSWRTWQRCLIEGWTLYAETWPRSGMTRSGIAYQLPPLVLLTDATESGSWPTPTVIDATLRATTKKGQKGRHGTQLAHIANDGRIHRGPKLWPTPTSRDYKDGSAEACKNVEPNGLLGRVVHLWATPQARDFRTGQEERWDNPSRSRNLNDQAGGKLSSIFVEYLMGYPLGWTALPDSATRSSRKSRKSSGKQSSTTSEVRDD